MVRGKHFLFAAFACLLLFVAGTVSQAIPVKATITQIVGDVQIMAPGGSWQPAKEGGMVDNGTQIKTGAKSSCVLRWSSQNTMKLTPFTQFTVKSIDVDPRSKTVKSDLDMFAGKVKLRAEKLQNPNSRFEVTTPSAVAGVRGTMGDLEQQAETLTGTTRDGMMEYEDNQGNTTTAGAGEQVKITTDGGLQEKTNVTQDEMNACTDDNDCASQKCEDGKCVGEDTAMNSASACSVLGSACSDTVKCCNGYACGADGLCAEGVKEAAAAACIKDGETCETDDSCCSGACEEGKCLSTEGETAKVSCTLSADGSEFPLSADKLTVAGTSVAGAKCDVNGASAEVGGDGTFKAEVSFDAAGELQISCTCTDAEGNSAGGGLTVNIKAPPTLMISSPSEGFISCPRIDISGQTEPGTVVNLNGISIFDLSDAHVYSDGGFSFDGFVLDDCSAPLDFQTIDGYGQITKVTVNPGTSREGVVFDTVTVRLKTSGQWKDGMTTVTANVMAKAGMEIPPGMIVSLDADNPGHLGDAVLRVDGVLKKSGLSNAGAGVHVAKADIVFQHGPAYPLTVVATVSGQESQPSSIFLDNSSIAGCVKTAPEAVGSGGDGVDNDCDGKVDEETRDGLDNDWDGLVDEDMRCNLNNAEGDCDRDGVANGEDCVPFDASVSIKTSNPECTRTYASITKQRTEGTFVEPDDGIDNDNDGRYDEEAIDGMDNDGDGRIDEDTTAYCDPLNPDFDCDFDGTPNGINGDIALGDCRPLDPSIKFTKTAKDASGNLLCSLRCDPYSPTNLDGDCDKDGLKNGEELSLGTDPNKTDTDGDGYLDGYEAMYGSDPRDPMSKPAAITAATSGTCIGGRTNASGQCVCPGDIILPAGMNSCICENGKILASDGSCKCPSGTTWNSTEMFCAVSDWRGNCKAGVYFDYAVGSCVTSCTGGQTPNTVTGECQCPLGSFMDYGSGQCKSECTPPFVANTAVGECTCPSAAPFYDSLANSCGTTCTGGQVVDSYIQECVCPAGTILGADANGVEKCLTSADIGSGRCDAFGDAAGDCDKDGLTNQQELEIYETNPYAADTDGDGYLDGGEVREGTNPTNPYSYPGATEKDTDGDGYTDSMETYYGSDPNNSASTPASIAESSCSSLTDMGNCFSNPACFWDDSTGRCLAAIASVDSDSDGFPDDVEASHGTNPDDPASFPGAVAAGECAGGKVKLADGTCACPTGTFFDAASGFCTVAAWSQCAAGQYMDWAIGSCVTACTGGQTADPVVKECYCPNGGFMDYNSGQCVSSCPAGMQPMGSECVCPPPTLYDGFADACVTSCTGGQVADPYYPECYCPPGTFYGSDANGNQKCVTSLDGGRCDAFNDSAGDCDQDGLSNMDELYYYNTNPYAADSDGDSYLDGYEVESGSNPNNPASFPGAVAAKPCTEYVMETNCRANARCMWDTAMNHCMDAVFACTGGKVQLSDGTCACPAGTEWDPAMMACFTTSWTQCAAGQYMDWAVGYCVTACTGGQTGDPYSGDCYCPAGTFMDYNRGQCGSSCPAGTVASGGECGCPAATPNYDQLTDSCVLTCSGGQQADPYSHDCYCPPGTYLDWGMQSCVQTTSTTICPFGTSGGGCDYYRMGDCDYDGMPNSTDPEPCRSSGETVCPADTDGAGCSRIDPAMDCDGDGAQNDYDFCPCRFGLSNDDFCPGGATSCPTGMFTDQISGQCVATCPPGLVGDPISGECRCAEGTFMDPATGYCMAGCPAGTVPNVYNECVCAAGTYFDNMVNACVTQCSAGQIGIDDPYFPNCGCAAGTYLDYATGMCQTMVGCDVAPYELGCACPSGSGSECMSQFCDPWNDVCAPAPADCSALVTDATCMTEPDCFWDYNNYRCVSSMGVPSDPCESSASPTDCGMRSGDGCSWDEATMRCVYGGDVCSHPDPVSCENDAMSGCVWDMAAGMCQYSGGFNCADFITTATCPSPDCMWDFGLNQCVMSGGASCTSIADSYSCEINGCVWNVSTGGCDFGVGSNCADFVTEATCSIEPGCIWDNYQCVMSGSGVGCENYFDATSCQSNGCVWDAGMNNCNYPGYNCGDFVTDATCPSPDCIWNPDTSQCIMAGAGCENYFDQNSCSLNGCVWNVEFCEYPATECPSFVTEATCPTPDCMWDFGLNQCVMSGGGCAAFMNDVDCSTDPGCMWDFGLNQCVMSGGGGSNCAGFTEATCSTDPGCMWDFGQNQCVAAGGGVDCSQFITDTTCSTEPSCAWDFSKSLCAAAGGGGCASFTNDVDCSTDPGCMWDFGQNQCVAAGGGDCTTYPDQLSCEQNNCYWNGSLCENLAPECPSFVTEATCPSPDCMWDFGLNQCVMAGGGGSNCAGFTEATCSTDPGCMWDFGLNQCVMSGGGCGTTPPYDLGCACTQHNECASSFCDIGSSTCMADPCTGPSMRPESCACTSGAECASSFCDTGTWTCAADCSAFPFPNECSCGIDADCASNFCDTNMMVCKPDCSTPGSYDNGCLCSSGTQCASTECNSCDSTCVAMPPFDTDTDTIPDACDNCPQTSGDPAYMGCPIGCPSCP